ncbi:MAG TPA: thioredoxin family protein, partial [Pyrinomonadaceae bacterium]|nr:thioredoxin family protein [Pyrinomonadaceae bacterium]
MYRVVRPAIIAAFLLSIVCFVTPALAAPPEDKWLRDSPGYQRAIQLQRELNVPLVVYFYADWCPYCRDFDKDYLTAPAVKQYLSGVVKVRINPDHGRPERLLAKQYGINGYPSFLIITKPTAGPRDVQPFRKIGSLTPAQFAKLCATADSLPVQRLNVPRTNVTASAGAANAVNDSLNEEPLPTLDAILTRYVTAIGGKDAQTKLTSRVSKGRIDVVGQSFGGKITTYAAAPNKALTIVNAEPFGSYKRGYDGRVGWNLSDKLGLETTGGMELASLAADSDFYRDIHLRELYPRMRLIEKVRDGVHDVYRVEATPRGGAPEILYFDVESALLNRRDVPRLTTQGMGNAEFYYSDWRVVDGVKLPFKTTELLPSVKYIFTLEDVRHNVPVDESLFRRPL